MKGNNSQLRAVYQRFRAAGNSAITSLQCAKTLLEFQAAEADGFVKLDAIPEEESYFDVYGDPEEYTDIHGKRVSAKQARDHIVEQLERDGNWCVVSYWFDGSRWQFADSVGQCLGYSNPLSPFENCYVTDLMASALRARQAHFEEMAGAI